MATADPTETHARALALGTLLAALGPLLAALSSAAAYVSAADGERVLAAALALVPVEPPGHPLCAWLTRLCLLLPLGPLALRAALAAALLYALAAGALFRAIERSLRARPDLPSALSAPLALAVTWLAFGCAALFPEAPRAEAAALALACFCLERLSAIESTWPQLDLRALRGAALAFGLLAPEQPALALALWIAALPLVHRLLLAFRLPLLNLAPLALGLPAWLALAFSVQHGPAELVPGSFRALLRTAFALAHGTAPLGAPAPLAASSARALLPYALAALGGLGALLALRKPRPRRVFSVWILTGLAALIGWRVLAAGAAFAALGLCAAAALSAFALASLLAGQRVLLGSVAALALGALAVSQLTAAARHADARDHAAIDALSDPLRRDLPARSVLLLTRGFTPALLETEAEEHARPDLLFTLKPWLLDLDAAERVAARAPELLPLLRADLLSATPRDAAAELPVVELAALAARRPLLLELTQRVERSAHRNLTPFAFYHQVATSDVGKSDVELAARDSEKRLARAFSEIALTQLDPGTLRWLAERHAAELDYALSQADAKLAAHALERLLRLPLPPGEQAARLAPFAAGAKALGVDMASFNATPRP